MLSCNRFMMGSKSENEKFLETKAAEVVIDLDAQDDESNFDLNLIKNLVVYDETGQRHPLESVWSDFKTILVFVRVRARKQTTSLVSLKLNVLLSF